MNKYKVLASVLGGMWGFGLSELYLDVFAFVSLLIPGAFVIAASVSYLEDIIE